MTHTDELHIRRSTTARHADVVLIAHADCERGYSLARQLLDDGVRVVVTARHPASLTRILHGQKNSEVVAIAADLEDPAQRAAVFARAEARLGAVTAVVDGRDPQPRGKGLRAA